MQHVNGNASRRQNSSLVPGRAVRADAQPHHAEVVAPWSVHEPAEDTDSGGGFEYAGMLFRHKGKLCLFALGGIVLGILVGIPQTPTYRVRSSLEVLSLNQDFMNTKQTSPVATNDESYETS